MYDGKYILLVYISNILIYIYIYIKMKNIYIYIILYIMYTPPAKNGGFCTLQKLNIAIAEKIVGWEATWTPFGIRPIFMCFRC